MATQREPGAQLIAQYTVPVRGTWNSLAIHAIPLDGLYDSMNVFLRKGKLRNRPGLVQFTDGEFDGPVLGAILATTPYDKIVLAITKNTVYELSEANDSTWTTAIKGVTGPYAASDTSPIDIALLETSGEYVAIIAEKNNRLRTWNATTHKTEEIVNIVNTVYDEEVFDFNSFDTTVTFYPPKASSVCIAARRVIALIPPHTLQWSSIFNYKVWNPLAVNRLAQTGDEGICVRPLSSLSFVLYKERSIYVARAQSGNDEVAFGFNEPIRVEGPAGVHAVVDVNGAHCYMTRNGRVAIFDGSRYPLWIADGLWLFLQDDIEPAYAHMIFGVYDHRLHLVKFVYPRRGDGGKLRGTVIINIPYEGIDIQDAGQKIYASFKGLLNLSCSMACEVRFNRLINRSLLFSHELEQRPFILDEESELDANEPFACHIQLPLQAMPDAMHHQVTIETFMERGKHFGHVMIDGVTSNGLETETGTIDITRAGTIDLERDPVVDNKGFSVPCRFFGPKYSWSSTSNVRYAGAVVYARRA